MGWASGFDAGSRLGQGLIDTYQDSKKRQQDEIATEAYKRAAREQTNTQSNYGQMDPNAVYAGEGTDGAMTNAEAASYGLNVPKGDKATGTGVTRQYGLGDEPTTWQDKSFTPDQRRTTGLQAKADSYRELGADDRADTIETGLFAKEQRGQQREMFGLQLKAAKRQATNDELIDADNAADRAAQGKVQSAYEALRKNPDGTERQLTNKDRDGLLLVHADALFDAKRPERGQKVIDEHGVRVTARTAQEDAQMKQGIKLAVGRMNATGGKDLGGVVDFYNKFVHDGAEVTSATADPKTGVITIKRVDALGKPLPDSTLASAAILSKAMESFQEPGALVAYTRDLFKDNLDARRTAATEKSASASMIGAVSQAAVNTERVTASKEGRAQQKESLEEITKLLPAYNAIKDKRSPEAIAILSDAVLNSAAKSGDAAKLLGALKDVAGRGGRKAIGKIEKTDDGVLVFDTDNKLTSFLTPSGLNLPPGMKETAYEQERKKAANAGVEARLGYDDDTGERVIGYIGKDGKGYATLAEASGAKAPTKQGSELPPTKAGGGLDTSSRGSPARSTDGGKTWGLSVPETIRDPSVPFYRTVPNPAYSSLSGKSFGSRQEAEAAYNATR